MKSLRTLLVASALVLVAGAASAAPASGLDAIGGTETTDSAATPVHHFGFGNFGRRYCGPRFGFHFGWNYRCYRPYQHYGH
jgi:hypothetical protein